MDTTVERDFLIQERRALYTLLTRLEERKIPRKETGIKKLGLDYHGVITEANSFLAERAKSAIQAGAEVHILTGASFTKEFQEELRGHGFEKGVHFTHFFSIQDHLRETGIPVHMRGGLPYADALAWDMAKGEYILFEGLNAIWDDSPMYGKYIPRSCVYYTFSEEQFDLQLDQVLHGGRKCIGRS